MKNPSMNYIFLLGGHDLEMVEIEKILVPNGQDFINHNLSLYNAHWKGLMLLAFSVILLRKL